MEVEIRREREMEFGEIRELVREAFLTAEHAEGDEHDFVERQRQRGGYIPELALVAKCDAVLAGHILLTRIFVETSAQQLPVLLLAELSVSLPLRRRGIAAALVNFACAEARTLGFQAVILVGDPDFYGRFGFRSSREFGLLDTNSIDRNMYWPANWCLMLQKPYRARFTCHSSSPSPIDRLGCISGVLLSPEKFAFGEKQSSGSDFGFTERVCGLRAVANRSY